jgi:hypothetical protein
MSPWYSAIWQSSSSKRVNNQARAGLMGCNIDIAMISPAQLVLVRKGNR